MSDYVVRYCDKLSSVLQSIENNGKGAVAVVDAENALIRVITDGDVRRALLSGYSLDSNVNDLEVSRQPIVAEAGCSSDELLALMDDNDVDNLVLTENGSIDSILHRRDLKKLWLSSPHLGEEELGFVQEAFDSNWIAPLGPNVDGFEAEAEEYLDSGVYALALSSGTAAIHLSLRLLGVGRGDIVLCSSLTFVASANPILYQGATPAFIDSEPTTWNMCPKALRQALVSYAERGITPKAIIVVNLYGQIAKFKQIREIADEYGVPIVEDAAESLGASIDGQVSGSFGDFGIFSFNGNKIITTSGGGMLISKDKEAIKRARHLATQAKEHADYYEHKEVGYNYRMSNVLAGIGRGQLKVLDDRVCARRAVFNRYVHELSDLNIFEWMADVEGYYSNRWLTAAVINPEESRFSPSELIKYMADKGIEARHVWKPMHMQPLYASCEYFHGPDNVSEFLFERGVCLPSGSNLTESEQARVISVIREFCKLKDV